MSNPTDVWDTSVHLDVNFILQQDCAPVILHSVCLPPCCVGILVLYVDHRQVCPVPLRPSHPTLTLHFCCCKFFTDEYVLCPCLSITLNSYVHH